MSSFMELLSVTEVDAENWITDRPLSYYLTKSAESLVITVPAGFITDFASVPKWARWLIPKTGKYNKAAVIHDYLYRKHLLSKAMSDLLFLEAMKVLGVSAWKRNIMYYSVVIGGSKSWKKTTEAV